MVKLETWQKIRWLQEYHARKKWERTHPGKLYKTQTIGGQQISRYTCTFCGERYYYIVGGHDRDAPQYHMNKKKKWLTICHVCWHLKEFFKDHQNTKSLEGASGCRFCSITLLLKQAARKRSKALEQKDSAPEENRLGTTVSRPTNWQPTGIRSGNAVSKGRERGGDVPNTRSTRRHGRKVSRH
jgi:hypothetical protein